MGQTQSGVITVEDFGNRVMGAAVVLLSSQLDTKLTFKQVAHIQQTDSHVLPLLTDAPETNPSASKLVALYSEYYNEDKQEHINKYITENILDREEHLNAFISLLINNLRSTKKSTSASYFNDKPAAAKPAMSIASASTIAAPAAALRSKQTTQFKSEQETPAELRSIKQSQQAVKLLETETKDKEPIVPTIVSEHSYRSVSVRPVKGSNKLQRRMHAVDQAIGAERVSQIKQNVEASYEDDNEEEFKAAVNIVKEDSADEFEHL